MVSTQQDVFGFDVSVENAVLVHVIQSLQQLVHVIFNLLGIQIGLPPSDRLVQVHLHQLKNQRQPSRRLVVQDFNEFYDVGVGGQFFQGLNFPESLNLLQIGELRLHALDGNVIAVFERLSLIDQALPLGPLRRCLRLFWQ